MELLCVCGGFVPEQIRNDYKSRNELSYFIRNDCLGKSLPKISGPKRHPNTKISPRIPCLNPPSFRGIQPLKFFVFVLFLLFEM